MQRSRQVTAEALRLRVWCRSRLLDGINGDTPRSSREAWQLMLAQEQCARLLLESLRTQPPRYVLPDFAKTAIIGAAAVERSATEVGARPDDVAWDILSAAAHIDERRTRIADLYELQRALGACDEGARARLNRRITASPHSRDMRRMIGAIGRVRADRHTARYYLLLARTSAATRARLPRIASRLLTLDISLLRRRPDRWTTKLRRTAAASLLSGVRLGVISEAALDERTQEYYSGGKEGEHIDYAGDEHNLSGWFDWERDLVASWFPPDGRVLVVAAGGGREMIALARRGYQVDGFECHAGLAAAGTDLMRRQRIRATIEVAPPDHAPETGRTYHAAILGWSAYTLVRGRVARLNLLREIHQQLHHGAPLLLSFFPREDEADPRPIVTAAANVIRRVRRAQPLEPGDSVGAVFTHRFTRTELEAELRDAHFDLVRYGTDPTGYAIALRVP